MNLQLIVTSFALIFSLSAFAQTIEKVREVQINGFRVFLVDLEKGNQFGYSFSVPFGSSDDEPGLFGRAHFYEHVYSRGSKKFPGHDTLIKAMSGFGYERNAATGFSYTFYYAKGHEKHGLDALRLNLASLHGPELEASSLTREKATVIDEVVTSAPARPARAAFMLPFWLLPEDGHRLKGHLVGTRETLQAMTAEDLQKLHENIYHSGNVSLSVFANFTNGAYTREQLIRELSQMLPAAQTPRPAHTPDPQTPAFAQDKILEMVNDKERFGYIFLPLTPNANLAEVQAYLNVLTSSDRNGLQDIARRKLGWATSVGGSILRAGSQQYAMLSFELTGEGFKNRQAFSRWMLEAVESGKNKVFSDAVLQQNRRIYKEKYRREQSNLESLIRNYPIWMTSPGNEAQLHMNWDNAVEIYNQKSLQNGAKAITLQNKAFAFMGPESQADDLSNEFFNLKYRIRPWQDAPSQLAAFDLSAVEATEVSLPGPSTSAPALSEETYTQTAGYTFVSVYNPKWEDRTNQLSLGFGNLDALQSLSLRALVSMAEVTLKPELANLESQGIALKIEADATGIKITSRGNTGRESAAIEWLLGQLKSLPASPQLLEQFRDSHLLSLKGHEDGFAGSIVIDVVKTLFSQQESGPLQRRQQIAALSLASIEDARTKLMQKSYKTIAVAGSYSAPEIESLKLAAKNFSPVDLDAPPEKTGPKYRVRKAGQFIEAWEDSGRKDIGVLRVLAGPTADNKKDKMAVAIVTRLMGEQVFLRNRPLGYVQGAGALPLSGQEDHVIFHGQVAKESELPKIESVWDEELDRWRNRQITSEEFEKSRTGSISQLSAEQNTSTDGLSRALGSLSRHNDPFAVQEMVAILKIISIEDVYQAVDKYLGKDAPSLSLRKEPGSWNEQIQKTRDQQRELLKEAK